MAMVATTDSFATLPAARAGPPVAFDEALEADGRPRPQYDGVLDALGACDLHKLSVGIAAELTARGVRFGTWPQSRPFVVDPVPRILPAPEWAQLAAGLGQRVRALNRFLADAYGERRIVEAGVVPARVIDGCEGYEPLMRGVPVPGAIHAHVAGLDVVRGPDGGFAVLEDNLRTPSGMAYAGAAREAVLARIPARAGQPRPLGGAVVGLGEALRGAAPDGRDDPSVVLLSDGWANSAWYEHAALAWRLGLPVVTLRDLEVADGRLWQRGESGRRPVDVVYRRTDVDRLTEPDGSPTALGEALLEPLRSGRLGVVNAFGNGVADDKLVQAYVEAMVRFYLREEPLLPSVATYDLGDPECREEALARLGELVVKPRDGYGGHGVLIGPRANAAALEQAAAAIRHTPERWVAQETVALSTHPTVCDGRLAPRHVDLRPFVFSSPEGVRVLAGGLTRVALREGELIVNSSQDGGAKDTWVLDA
jgi:uncharacterized circularly permuted ATP-grasp superfamily protein